MQVQVSFSFFVQQPDTCHSPAPLHPIPNAPIIYISNKLEHYPPPLSMPLHSKYSFYFKLYNLRPVSVVLLSHSCHMPCQSHPPWCGRRNNVRPVLQVTMHYFSFVLCFLLSILNTSFSDAFDLYTCLALKDFPTSIKKKDRKIIGCKFWSSGS